MAFTLFSFGPIWAEIGVGIIGKALLSAFVSGAVKKSEISKLVNQAIDNSDKPKESSPVINIFDDVNK